MRRLVVHAKLRRMMDLAPPLTTDDEVEPACADDAAPWAPQLAARLDTHVDDLVEMVEDLLTRVQSLIGEADELLAPRARRQLDDNLQGIAGVAAQLWLGPPDDE